MDLNTLSILRNRAKDIFTLYLYQENVFTPNIIQNFQDCLRIENNMTIHSNNLDFHLEFYCWVDKEKLNETNHFNIKYSDKLEKEGYGDEFTIVLSKADIELSEEDWVKRISELVMKIHSYNVSYNNLKIQEQLLNDARELSTLNENQAWLYNLPKNIPNFKVLQQRIQDYMLAKTTNMTPIECGILYAQFSKHSDSEKNQRLIKSIEDCLQSKYAITCDPLTDELYYFVTGLLYEYEPIPKEIFGSQVTFDKFIESIVTNDVDKTTCKEARKINFESFKKVKNY